MDSYVIPRLKMLRYVKGLTQQELAEAAGVSRDTYIRIESGQSDAKASTMERIAEALGVDSKDLLTPFEMPVHVRFRSGRRVNVRDMVLFDVMRWMRDYSFLEELLADHIHWALGALSVEMSRIAGGRERAMRCASEARELLALDPDESIRDIGGLLESGGVKIYPRQIMSEGLFGLSVGPGSGGPLVVVNVWDSIPVERWIFTAAHELGHLLLHLDSYDMAESAENAIEEAEADVFAGYFLMPQAAFDSEWHDARGLPFYDRVLKLKRMFRVSYRTVLFRLSGMDGLGNGVWGRFQAEHRRRCGDKLSNADTAELERLTSSDFVPDRFARLVRRALEEGLISVSRAADLMRIDMESMRSMGLSWESAP